MTILLPENMMNIQQIVRMSSIKTFLWLLELFWTSSDDVNILLQSLNTTNGNVNKEKGS